MRWFLALLAVAIAPSALPAAVVEVKPTASAVLNMNFTSLDPQPSLDSPIVRLPARDEPYLIQVDVSMRIYDLQPGQVGFSNTAFDVEVAGDGLIYKDVELGIPAWNDSVPDIDFNGFCTPPTFFCVNPWDINADDGTDNNDAKAIILAGVTTGFGPPEQDPRRILGQGPNGELAGTVYVKLPAALGASASVETLTPWDASTYDETGFSTTAGNTAVGGQTVTFVVVPEPGAAALLVVGLLSLALGIRR